MGSDTYKGAAGRQYTVQEALNKTVYLLEHGGPGGVPIFVLESTRNDPNGFAGLDGSGLLDPSVLPPLAISDVFVVADQTERLALTAQVGDVAKQTDNGKTYMLKVEPASVNGNWIEIADYYDTFLDLLDTPSSYPADQFFFIQPKATLDGLEFTEEPALDSDNFIYLDGSGASKGLRYNSTRSRIEIEGAGLNVVAAGGVNWGTLHTGELHAYEGTIAAPVDILKIVDSAEVGFATDELKVFAAGDMGGTPVVTLNDSGGVLLDHANAKFRLPANRPIIFDGIAELVSLRYNSANTAFEFGGAGIEAESAFVDGDVRIGGGELFLESNVIHFTTDGGSTYTKNLKYIPGSTWFAFNDDLFFANDLGTVFGDNEARIQYNSGTAQFNFQSGGDGFFFEGGALISEGAFIARDTPKIYFTAASNNRFLEWDSWNSWLQFSGAAVNFVQGLAVNRGQKIEFAQPGSGTYIFWNDPDLEIVESAGAIFMTDGSGKSLELGTNIDVDTRKIINVVDPTSDQDAATKKYVDDQLTDALPVYRQAAEPTLAENDDSAIWVDTDDSDRTYLVFRRGTGDQVKVELS